MINLTGRTRRDAIKLLQAYFTRPCCFLSHRCEADPVALSKYVLALVEKDREVSELKQLCADQLEVFLGQG